MPSGTAIRPPDTARVALAAVLCEPYGGLRFLFERDGYLFGQAGFGILEAPQWHLFDFDTLSSVMVRSAGGAFEPMVAAYDTVGDLANVRVLGLSDFRVEASRREGAASAQRIESIRKLRWSPAMTRAAINREVVIGMTAKMVELSWGEPQSVNRTVTAARTREQWVYEGGSYVYLTNGVVTAIQDKR
jgi:hypothetical protein